MTLAELLALLENLAELTDEQLTEALAGLRAAADERLDGDLTDDVLVELQTIAEAIESIDAQVADREAQDADRTARAEALAARIRGEAAEASDGDDPDPEADPADPEPEADPAADDPEAEPEADPEVAPAEADDPVPVAASAANAPANRVTRVAARRPAAMAPRSAPATPRMSLTASANVPGVEAGAPIESADQLLSTFDRALRASSGYRGPRLEIPLVRAGYENAVDGYGAERTLGRDAQTNEGRIMRVNSPEAIRAAGGICAPSPVNYDQDVIGDDTRPVRDSAMTRFGADRGGVRLFPYVTLEEVEDSVDVWTAANDLNPSDPTTKPCLVLTCPEDDETVIEAITKCLEIGNFRARFFAEQVEAWLKQAGVWHSRFAENRLIAKIAAGSTQTTTATVLGTSTDVLTALDRASAGFRSRHRAASVSFRFVAPFWLKDQMRVDIARQAFGTADERLAIADAEIETWFRARNINVTWTYDGEAGQIFGAQVDGTLLGWPSTVITYLYPEGSWLFLDAGSLDFGIVRDSTLNSTNDFQIFSETFEGAAFHGPESLRIVLDTCPDGSLSAPVDINPCTSGS